MTRAEVGLTVTHRRYVPYSHAHYAGSLVDGAYSLAAFGDVATELCIRTDGDEGLFASYSSVQFLAPVRAGDGIEISLFAFAAVVVGGTSVLGGRGSTWRTVLGVLFLGLIVNGFNLIGVDPIYQQIVQGAIILLAVAADSLSRKR